MFITLNLARMLAFRREELVLSKKKEESGLWIIFPKNIIRL